MRYTLLQDFPLASGRAFRLRAAECRPSRPVARAPTHALRKSYVCQLASWLPKCATTGEQSCILRVVSPSCSESLLLKLYNSRLDLYFLRALASAGICSSLQVCSRNLLPSAAADT